ncbi:MAG: hypothetical protein ABEI98_08720 [Halorhabdus sp.]
MFLLFALGHEDVFSVEDLGIREGLRSVCVEGLGREAMIDRAERWRPYRSYASLYPWRVAD